MKVLYSWLAEFVPDLKIDAQELGELFSEMGLECDEVIDVAAGLEGIVVARVAGLAPHPDADRIQLVDVDDGSGENIQVCCGAFNMSVGDVVPLATIGAVMQNGMEIAKRKLRGEWSNGMLCSPGEIGLAGDDDGIMILDVDAPSGTPLADALGLGSEVVYDLDLTPNRPDALSMVGVARDLAAKAGLGFEIPSIELDRSGTDASELVSATISDPDLCGTFGLWVLSGLDRSPSPSWMQQRLALAGMRPIDGIVDISNYVMLEYGHPNHTYDLDTVPGGRFDIRRATDGEELVTLDGSVRTLVAADGVIANDAGEPIGLAGVMGGQSTEISESTTTIALEMAWWDPPSIGVTSKRLGLRSEASQRFEKGVDPQIAEQAALRFAQLAATRGATLHPGAVRADGNLPAPAAVTVQTERVNGLLGSSFTTDEIVAYLTPLGFECDVAGNGEAGEEFTVGVPSYRPDTTIEADVCEEVARMHGYENFAKRVPLSPLAGGLTARQLDVRRVREALVGQGFAEAAPMPFLAPGDLERSGVRSDAVSVTNPLAADESVMRTSLLPGLAKTLGYNASHRREGLSLFELGRCFAANPDGGVPIEWEEVAAALGGAEAPEAVAAALRLCKTIGLTDVVVRNAEVGGLHPARSAQIVADGAPIGVVGELDPDVAASWGVAERVGWFSFRLGGEALWHGGHGLLTAQRSTRQLRPVAKFPSSDLDLAFVIDEGIAADEVASTLREAGGDRLVAIQLFDVYRGDSLPEGTRSLAFRMRLQSPDATLTDDETAELQARLVDAVESVHSARLRG